MRLPLSKSSSEQQSCDRNCRCQNQRDPKTLPFLPPHDARSREL